MEKRGVVEPGRTPDTNKPPQGVKTAQTKTGETERLDDDFTKRAADTAADSLKNKNNGS